MILSYIERMVHILQSHLIQKSTPMNMNTKTKLLLLIIGLFGFTVGFFLPGAVLGEEASEFPAAVNNSIVQNATSVTLSDLIEEAFEANPDIKAAKARWAQVIEKYPQETALDDPMLNFSYYVENVETRVGPQNYSIGIAQKFPFPGTLHQKGKVVEKEIKIARLQYEKTVRDVIVDLKQAVYELQYLDGAIQITKENQTILQEILMYAENRYTDQSTGLNDVFRAESQLVQLDYDLITLRELRAVQQSIINSILDHSTDANIPVTAASIPRFATPTIESLDKLVTEQNQEIQIAAMDVEKSGELIHLARKQNLPTFSVGARYIETGEAVNPRLTDSGKDPLIIGGSMSIPLWFGKNKARVRYAEEGKKSAEEKENSVENTMHVQLRKAFFQMQNAHRLVVLYRDHLIPQANRSMQIAEEWNRNRKGSVSEILEVQSVWFNFNLAWLRACVDYAQGFAELERVAGGSLSSVMESGE